MKGCDSKVTIWRRNRDNSSFSFEREILPVLCVWRGRSERRASGSGSGAGFSARSVVTVIIPYFDGLSASSIATGDLIALGEHDIEITGERPYRESDIKTAFRENDKDGKHNIIAVSSVVNNLRGQEHARHLKIEGVG